MAAGQSRFSVLDGLRFVVALVVATFHLTLFAGIPILQRGYLGVDFFFGLSGFVISFAYTDRFTNGGSLREFLLRRLIRLYPMIVFGSIFGFFLNAFDPIKLSDLFDSLVLLPRFTSFLFPVNVPIWSLFYEVLANLMFALISIQWTHTIRPVDIDRVWAAVFIFCLVANAHYAFATGSLDNGSIASTFFAGFPRAGQSFCAGILLNRMSEPSRPIGAKWLPVLVGALIIGMAMPVFQRLDGLYDISIVTFAFPLIIYFGSRIHLSPNIATLSEAGGKISYPLYLIHFPFVVVAFHYAHGPTWLIKARVAGLLIGVIAASTVIYYLYDVPARHLLQRLLYGNRKNPSA